MHDFVLFEILAFQFNMKTAEMIKTFPNFSILLVFLNNDSSLFLATLVVETKNHTFRNGISYYTEHIV